MGEVAEAQDFIAQCSEAALSSDPVFSMFKKYVVCCVLSCVVVCVVLSCVLCRRVCCVDVCVVLCVVFFFSLISRHALGLFFPSFLVGRQDLEASLAASATGKYADFWTVDKVR